MAGDARRFQKGTGVYTCAACGKSTRSTGRCDNENVGLCAKCYDEGGLENEHSDSGGNHELDLEGKRGPHPDCPTCKEEVKV